MMDANQSPSMQLQAKLEKLPLFHKTHPECIRDVRQGIAKNKQEHQCQNYAALFKDVCNIAFWLSYADGGIPHGENSVLESQRAELADLERDYRIFREHHHLSTQFRRRHRDLRVTQAFEIMRETIDAVGLSLRLTPKSIHKPSIVQQMFNAFKEHGPVRYPDAAIHASIALIFNQVGILNEKGCPFTSGGIQRALHRST